MVQNHAIYPHRKITERIFLMGGNPTILWLKMFDVLGAKVKHEWGNYMVSLKYDPPDFDLFCDEVRKKVDSKNISIFFVDDEGDRISVRDNVSLIYCLGVWDMKNSLVFFAKERNIFSAKYILFNEAHGVLF